MKYRVQEPIDPEKLRRYVGEFRRFTAGSNSGNVYDGEVIDSIPAGASLYRSYPVFGNGTSRSGKASVDEAKIDRVICRLADGRLMAVPISRLYDKLPRPKDWSF